MPCDADHVDALGRHVDGEDSRGLGGVQQEEQAVLPGKAAHPPDFHHVPGQIGGVGADHSFRVGPQKPGKGGVIQPLIPHSEPGR